MPTSHCNYPNHHGPSAGPPLGLLAAIALGAVVIAHWHTVVVALVVVAVLAAVAGGVMLLVHAAHAEPYEAPDRGQDTQAAVADLERRVTAQVGQELLQHRVGQLERDSVRDRVAALETQQAARAEVERAVTQLAIAQQQRQLDAIEPAGWSERSALPVGGSIPAESRADWWARNAESER
jgi:hypothetical protein